MDALYVQPARCTAKLPETLSKHHIGELKLDGARYTLHLAHDPTGRTEGNTLLSRHKSKVDRINVDKTANVPHITGVEYPGLEGCELDGEMFHTDISTTTSIMGASPAKAIERQKEIGWIKYYVWDIPVFKGKDIRGLPLTQRRKILVEVVKRMKNPNIKTLTQYPHDKVEELFLKVVGRGGEGLVVKDVRQGYGSGWSKMKKSYDISVFISGFKPGNGKYTGMVGAMEVSVIDDDGKPKAIGYASGFVDSIREDMTEEPEKYIGRVVDVYAQELSKTDRLRHPTFYRFREDGMDAKDCTLQKVKDDMKEQKKAKSRRRRIR